MPTGYTYAVQEGTVTELKDFAMSCARAMGACIMMRDEPDNTPIPERWEPSVAHHDEAITRATKRKAELAAMTKDAIEQVCLKAYEESHREYLGRRKENSEERKRYETMLAKVEAWTPPTADHAGLKSFMVSQLKESITADCGYTPAAPVLQTADDWLRLELNSADRDIAYYTNDKAEEIERTESRNRWIAELRKSFNAT